MIKIYPVLKSNKRWIVEWEFYDTPSGDYHGRKEFDSWYPAFTFVGRLGRKYIILRRINSIFRKPY